MNLTPLAGKKTYIASAIGLIGAALGALDGQITWPQAFAIIMPCVIGFTVRHGISTTKLELLAKIAASAADMVVAAAKKTAPLLFVCILGTLALSACSATQQAKTLQTLAKVQTGLQTAKLVVDQGACESQKAANDATALLTSLGDRAGAAQTAKISATAGAACLTLAAPPPPATAPPAASPAAKAKAS